MIIQASYTTQLKASLRIANESLDMEAGSRLSTLVRQLAERHGASFSDLVLDGEGGLLPSVLIGIDEQQVNVAEDPELHEGQEVVFLSAISGG